MARKRKQSELATIRKVVRGIAHEKFSRRLARIARDMMREVQGVCKEYGFPVTESDTGVGHRSSGEVMAVKSLMVEALISDLRYRAAMESLHVACEATKKK